MSNKTIQPTERQRAQLATLQKNFGLSPEDTARCLYFSREQDRPYIPPDLLITIARQTGQFQSIEPTYSTYVQGLEQLIYKATVVDQDGRSITRVGVATLGETPGGIAMDAHKLAEGRALNSALADAGFNPFKSFNLVGFLIERHDRAEQAANDREFPLHSGPAVSPDLAAEKHQAELRSITDSAERRRKDLGRIKLLAREKGLVVRFANGRDDDSPYRDWLSTNFQTRTAATMDAAERAQVINKLRLHEIDYLSHIPTELHEDALIA